MERVVPYFQPIINLENNKVWRYECLARLVTESEQIFLPSDFLYIVDRQRANIALTHHIYALGHQYFAAHNMPWSINLSAVDLRSEETITWLVNESNNQDNCMFGLEISFEDAVEQLSVLKDLLTRSRDLSISIDDINGSSADLTALLEIGVDAIKLSGKFANSVVKSASAQKDLLIVIELCKHYSTKLVAEHIEDKRTCDQLRTLGVLYGQGFYFSCPKSSV